MKILHAVKSFTPLAGGMFEVSRQISENLASLGHDITIATSKLPENAETNTDLKIIQFDFSKIGEGKKYD